MHGVRQCAIVEGVKAVEGCGGAVMGCGVEIWLMNGELSDVGRSNALIVKPSRALCNIGAGFCCFEWL